MCKLVCQLLYQLPMSAVVSGALGQLSWGVVGDCKIRGSGSGSCIQDTAADKTAVLLTTADNSTVF